MKQERCWNLTWCDLDNATSIQSDADRAGYSMRCFRQIVLLAVGIPRTLFVGMWHAYFFVCTSSCFACIVYLHTALPVVLVFFRSLFRIIGRNEVDSGQGGKYRISMYRTHTKRCAHSYNSMVLHRSAQSSMAAAFFFVLATTNRCGLTLHLNWCVTPVLPALHRLPRFFRA